MACSMRTVTLVRTCISLHVDMVRLMIAALGNILLGRKQDGSPELCLIDYGMNT
jgi:hypothetical protein